MVNVLQDILNLDDWERRGLDFYQILKTKDNLRVKAANVLVKWMKTNMALRGDASFSQRLLTTELSAAIKEFRQARQIVKGKIHSEFDEFYDKIAMDITVIRENILALNWRQMKMQDLADRMKLLCVPGAQEDLGALSYLFFCI
jgi:hypothetical protein